jgi:hypothetical protein
MAAAGIVVIVLDLRIVALDILPDPVGWVLVALAAGQLALRVPALFAIVAALASAAEVSLPGGQRLVDPRTDLVVARCPQDQVLEAPCYTEVRFDPTSGWRLALLAVAVVAGGLALGLLLLELRRRAIATASQRLDALADCSVDDPTPGRLNLLAAATVALWALPQAVGMAWAAIAVPSGRYDPVWDPAAEYVALVGLVALAAVTLELVRHRNERWALPVAWDRASTWTTG